MDDLNDELKCPICKSINIQSFEMSYKIHKINVDGESATTGGGLSSNGLSVQGSQTKIRSNSGPELLKDVAPPETPEYALAFYLLLIILSPFAIYNMLISEWQWHSIGSAFAATIIFLAAFFLWGRNYNIEMARFNYDYEDWKNKMICYKCGHKWIYEKK